jgi:hypothetical protein
MSESYNGWANYETWNIALWIQNDEALYAIAKDIARSKYRNPYKGFVHNMRLCEEYLDVGIYATPDGVSYMDSTLDIPALDEMIRSL